MRHDVSRRKFLIRKTKEQIILPKAYRILILRTAHLIPLTDHLRVNKSFEKILRHFYWPGLKRDVAEFNNTCLVRQPGNLM